MVRVQYTALCLRLPLLQRRSKIVLQRCRDIVRRERAGRRFLASRSFVPSNDRQSPQEISLEVLIEKNVHHGIVEAVAETDQLNDGQHEAIRSRVYQLREVPYETYDVIRQPANGEEHHHRDQHFSGALFVA